MRPSVPRPTKKGKGERDGGCSIKLVTGETVKVLSSAEATVAYLNRGKITEFERNDGTIYSGDKVWINPAYVVKIT